MFIFNLVWLIKICRILYQICGVPVVSPVTKIKKLHSVYSFIHIFVVLCISLHSDFQNYRNDLKLFQLTLARSFFLLQIAIVLVLNIFHHTNLITLLLQMETIHKTTTLNRKVVVLSVLQALIVVFTFLIQLIDIYAVGTSLLTSLNNNSKPIFILRCMFSVFVVPSFALVYSSFFTLSIGHFVELNGYGNLAKLTSMSRQHRPILSVMPPIESWNDEEAQNSTSENRISLCPKGCLKVLFLMRQFRTQQNKWFYSSIVFIILNLMFYFPFIVYFIKEGWKNHPEKHFLGLHFGSLILTPVVLNLLLQQKTYHCCVKTIRQVFKTSAVWKRKLLWKFVENTKDSYPNTYCYLFEFDADFCSTVMETVILIINTMLV